MSRSGSARLRSTLASKVKSADIDPSPAIPVTDIMSKNNRKRMNLNGPNGDDGNGNSAAAVANSLLALQNNGNNDTRSQSSSSSQPQQQSSHAGGNGGPRTRGMDMDSSQESMHIDLDDEKGEKNSSGSGGDETICSGGSRNNDDKNSPTSVEASCSQSKDTMDADKDDSSSSSDSDSSSDSESEIDEETFETKKSELSEDMKDLETQFLYMREVLFKERIEHIDNKLEEVKAGKAKEYLQPLEKLQDNMRVRIEIAGYLRDLKLESTRNKFEAEELAAKQNYESDKSLLYDAIKDDLEDKIHRLEEDRNNDFTTELWLETAVKRKNKKSIDIFGEKKKKPITITGPFIVYMLNDVDILEDTYQLKKLKLNLNKSLKNNDNSNEDWTIIKKAHPAPKRKYAEMVF